MAKFIYRMQNILDIKYKLEEQAKQVFLEAQNRYLQELEKQETLKRRKYLCMMEMRKIATQRLDVLELERYNQSLAIFDDMIQDQKEVVFRAMAEMDRTRAELDKIMQERKTHEKLKEHQFEAFLQELNAEEMKEIDQLVSYQYNTEKEGE